VNATILRSEVLKQLDTGEPFQMEFVTADRKRGTGGELIKVENWAKHKGNPPIERRPSSPLGGNQRGALKPATIKVVNIHNPFNRIAHPIAVHLLLILTFNGKRVLNG
jgi:hypothetical protein